MFKNEEDRHGLVLVSFGFDHNVAMLSTFDRPLDSPYHDFDAGLYSILGGVVWDGTSLANVLGANENLLKFGRLMYTPLRTSMLLLFPSKVKAWLRTPYAFSGVMSRVSLFAGVL